jgi:hypothetical protein
MKGVRRTTCWGVFDADGKIPCQIDGGLKCFGHPIGASGLRMIYENYLQLIWRAGARQMREQPTLALSHNLGGMPNQNVSAVAIVGLLGAWYVDRDVFDSLRNGLRRYVRERLRSLGADKSSKPSSERRFSNAKRPSIDQFESIFHIGGHRNEPLQAPCVLLHE